MVAALISGEPHRDPFQIGRGERVGQELPPHDECPTVFIWADLQIQIKRRERIEKLALRRRPAQTQLCKVCKAVKLQLGAHRCGLIHPLVIVPERCPHSLEQIDWWCNHLVFPLIFQQPPYIRQPLLTFVAGLQMVFKRGLCLGQERAVEIIEPGLESKVCQARPFLLMRSGPGPAQVLSYTVAQNLQKIPDVVNVGKLSAFVYVHIVYVHISTMAALSVYAFPLHLFGLLQRLTHPLQTAGPQRPNAPRVDG